MKKIKRIISWLILLSWLFTTAFQSLPQSATFFQDQPASAPAALAAPDAFGKVSPSDGAVSQPTTALNLAWNPSLTPGVTYDYCLRLNKNQNCPKSQWVSAGVQTSVTLGPLASNTVYYWQVRAVDGNNITYADNGWWSFRTVTGAPAAFGKITPQNSAVNQPLSLTLSWGTAGTSASHEYCYSTTNNCSAIGSGTWYSVANATSVSISGLNYATPYYWQVRAINSGGTAYTYADGGNAWSFTTLMAPPAPFVKQSPPQAALEEPLNLRLEWSPSTGAAGYTYCIDTLDNGICDGGEISVGLNNSVTLPTLAYNTQYFWQVYATNSTGKTAADGTTWRNFTTQVNPPASFTKINPMDADQNQSLTPWLYWWSPSAAGNTYTYCLSSTNGVCSSSWSPVAENTPIHITIPLVNNTTYYWQVRATNGGGFTDANNNVWWSFTTLKAGPSSSNQPFSVAEDAILNHAQLTATSNYAKIFSLVGGLPAGTLDFHSDGGFAYTPAANFNGPVTFQFVVSDGYNPPAGPYTATITVTPVNDAPVLAAIPDQLVAAGDLLTFIATASDVDIPYGDSLVYSVVETLPPGMAINAQTGMFSWITTTALAPGNYTFTIKVTDSGTSLLSDTKPVKIVVTSVTPPPVGVKIYIPLVSR